MSEIDSKDHAVRGKTGASESSIRLVAMRSFHLRLGVEEPERDSSKRMMIIEEPFANTIRKEEMCSIPDRTLRQVDSFGRRLYKEKAL